MIQTTKIQRDAEIGENGHQMLATGTVLDKEC